MGERSVLDHLVRRGLSARAVHLTLIPPPRAERVPVELRFSLLSRWERSAYYLSTKHHYRPTLVRVKLRSRRVSMNDGSSDRSPLSVDGEGLGERSPLPQSRSLLEAY